MSSDEMLVLEDGLRQIIRSIDTVEGYMTHFGNGYDVFAGSEMYQDACLSKLNQILRCTGRIHRHHPDIYERYMGCFTCSLDSIERMTAVDDTDRDTRLVWSFLTDEMPRLRDSCERIISDELNGGTGW